MRVLVLKGTCYARHDRVSLSIEGSRNRKVSAMNEVKATTMATTIAKAFGITREQAFDLILATAQKLEIRGTRFSAKTAGEIEAVIAQDMRAGSPAKLNRPVIGA